MTYGETVEHRGGPIVWLVAFLLLAAVLCALALPPNEPPPFEPLLPEVRQ